MDASASSPYRRPLGDRWFTAVLFGRSRRPVFSQADGPDRIAPVRRRTSARDLAWTLGAAALAAVLSAWLLHRWTASPPTVPSARTVDPSVVARPAPPSAGPARPALPSIRLSPPYEVADGLTILTATRRIRLAGLEGPASEAACHDPDNRLWACGLQARAALHSLIRDQALICQPTGDRQAAALLASCSAGPTLIGEALVRQGFARPIAGEPGVAAELDPDLADAKAAGRGLWNGGWRIRP